MADRLKTLFSLVRALARGPVQVSELADVLHLPLRTCYHGLATLAEYGLQVQRSRKGRRILVYVRPAEANRWLRSIGAAPLGLIGVRVVSDRRSKMRDTSRPTPKKKVR